MSCIDHLDGRRLAYDKQAVPCARGVAIAVSVLVAAMPPMSGATSPTAARAADSDAAVSVHTIGPPLTNLGAKLASPDWLVAWLLRPSRLRPHQRMRRLRIDVDEARALAGYLYVGAPASGSTAPAWQGGDALTGEQLFVACGCRGCHTIGAARPSPLTHAPDLAGIGIKVRPEWLFNWLKSPRAYDPNTAMPQLVLSDDDIRHLVAFLLSRREGAAVVATAPRFQPGATADQARAVIDRFDCARCHLISGFQSVEPTTRWAVVPRGCDACHHATEFSPPRHAQSTPDGTPDERVLANGRMLIEYYNCRGCHRIEGSGGVIADHLERKTLAPPTLEGEGARVQASWLIEFLQRPTTLRPWLQMRMPHYGLSPEEAAALARYFALLARVPAVDEPVDAAGEATLALGRRRFAHFKCVQCHPAANDAGPCTVEAEDLSIDLLPAKTRLRPSWVRDFLARPKLMVGMGTRMPAVFYSTDGIAKVEQPQRDIAAITAYLFAMTESPPASAARELDDNAKQPIDWSTQPY